MPHLRSSLILSLIFIITNVCTANEEHSTSPYDLNDTEQMAYEFDQDLDVITFSEFPLDTRITNQYADRGIIFGPDNNVPYIEIDYDSPSSPVLSGWPPFYGAIEGRFVDPNDGVSPMTVSVFSLDAGKFNQIGSTRIEWFGSDNTKLGEQTSSIIGFQHFEIKGCYIARWRISIIPEMNEPAGFAIDNVKCDFGPCGFNKIDDINDDNCVKAGNEINYTISYELGAIGDTNVMIIDYLPNEVNYNSSTHDGHYNAIDRTVTWNLGDLSPWTTGSVELSVLVNDSVLPGHTIINIANLVGNSFSRITEEYTNVCYWGEISPNVIFVDNKAINGLNNGTDWNDAFLDFNDALKEAPNYIRDFGSCEIWVAAGQPYRPTFETPYYWQATFRIPPGNLAIRGHFGGIGRYETSPDQRDFTNPDFETILDGWTGSEYSEKATYVVTCDDIGTGLVLDGFTFTGAINAGLYINYYSDPSIVRCKFNGNGSNGIYAEQYSYPDVADCQFLENGTAGIYSNDSSWPYVKDCTFDGNNLNSYGLQVQYADILVENCVIRRQSNIGMFFMNSSLTITGCKIENNQRGINCSYCSYVEVEDCNIQGNNSYGIYCANSSLGVTNCTIQGNNNNGIWAESASVPTITNNIICRNKDNGIYIDHCEHIAIKNNWIYLNGNNGTDSGLNLQNSISPAYIRNNTIIGNLPYGIYVYYGQDPCLANDIIRQNGTNVFGARGLEGIEASYCCIEGGFAGTGNIDCDPCFVAPDANNFRLKPISLCIDAGDPCADYDGETDIDGEPRVANGRADLGADEVFWPKGDYNLDEILNFIDFAQLSAEWQEPNSNKSLDSDNDVDIDDLIIFCNDWLWTAAWSENYGMLESQTGIGDMVVVAEIPEVFNDENISQCSQELSTDIVAEGPMSDEQIQGLIDWTEQLWQSNPDIRELVDPNDVQRVIDSLKEQIND